MRPPACRGPVAGEHDRGRARRRGARLRLALDGVAHRHPRPVPEPLPVQRRRTAAMERDDRMGRRGERPWLRRCGHRARSARDVGRPAHHGGSAHAREAVRHPRCAVERPVRARHRRRLARRGGRRAWPADGPPVRAARGDGRDPSARLDEGDVRLLGPVLRVLRGGATLTRPKAALCRSGSAAPVRGPSRSWRHTAAV